MGNIFFIALIFALVLAGIIMSVLNLPGIWAVWIAFAVISYKTGFTSPSLITLYILFGVGLLVSFADNIVAILGAKKFNSSKWGITGAIVGSFVGLIFGGPVGFILGPLLGATIFELAFAKKDTNNAIRSGIGALIGFFMGVVIKFGVTFGLSVWAIALLFK